MLQITPNIAIPLEEITISAIRSGGPGGQHVNKVSSAIHLRFDILASSLPQTYKDHLLMFKDSRIAKDGVIVIKAQLHRNQQKNKADALNRLAELIVRATQFKKSRRATKPTRNSQRKRVDKKVQRGKTKSLRGKVDH